MSTSVFDVDAWSDEAYRLLSEDVVAIASKIIADNRLAKSTRKFICQGEDEKCEKPKSSQDSNQES